MFFVFGLLFGFVACERDSDHIYVIHDTIVVRDTTGIPTDTTQVSILAGFDADGASINSFSVGENKTVRFSRGNLQYCAASNTWRFAEHQYEIIGVANNNISSFYTGWIDLFGWGTSGWNSGASAYQPWSTSTDWNEYVSHSFMGDYANADWGVYNAIQNGGNRSGIWRTLTTDEWYYLFNSRTDSELKYGSATVNNIYGVVVLSDNFVLPSSFTFTPGMNGYESNVYTAEDWVDMESAGAIFLPSAGTRYGSETNNNTTNNNGYYWSSTLYNQYSAYSLNCYRSRIEADAYSNRNAGHSVRLVTE